MNFHGDVDVVDRYPVDDRINDDSSHKSHGEDDENPHLFMIQYFIDGDIVFILILLIDDNNGVDNGY